MVVTDYNEQFLDKRGTDHLIDELKAYIDNIATGNVDLSDYVTKEELQAKLDALDIKIDLSAYATKKELTDAINNIVSSYALKTEIPTKVSQLENDSGYLSSIPNEYVTDTELNAKGYLTDQDLSAYALKTDIPSLDGYATTQYVDNAIANIPSGGTVDLSDYYTKEETNALIPSTDGLATTEYVDNAVSNIPPTDLSNYYTKNETYSKTEVDNLVANSGGSGGGASGITYAYDTEIATGDTYFDGRPIYMKIFHIDALSSSPSDAIVYNNYHQQTPFADKIIASEPVWYTTGSSQNVFTGNVLQSFTPVYGSYSVAISRINELLMKVAWTQVWQSGTNFGITVTRGQDMYKYACDVFVKYVKSA